MVAPNILLHCGGEVATFDDIKRVTLPPATSTYVPVSHDDFAFNVEKVCSELLHDYEPVSQQYALSHGLVDKERYDGARMFGIHTFKPKNNPNGMGLAAAFRNSYDKSMKLGLAIGARVFVCDNLALSGSVATLSLLHTGDVLQRLYDQTVLAINKSRDGFTEVAKDAARMKDVRVKDDDAYRCLGLAFGRGALTPTQLTSAVRSWKNEEYMGGFGETRSAWSLYNAGTEALKGVRINKVMERHVQWHKLVMGGVERNDFDFVDETGLEGDDLVKARIANAQPSD